MRDLILRALPASKQLTFINKHDLLGWVYNLAKRKGVDHEIVMETLLSMLEDQTLVSVELGINSLFMVGPPASFSGDKG